MSTRKISLKSSPESRNNKFIGLGIIFAIISSICCIVPTIGIILGTYSFASFFPSFEYFRPYFIAVTVFIFAFLWYKKLRQKDSMHCDTCKLDRNFGFFHTKTFLALSTIITLLIMAFPYYAHFLHYSFDDNRNTYSSDKKVEFRVTGMTCKSCEKYLYKKIKNLDGVGYTYVSAKDENIIVEFDSTRVSISEIQKAIDGSGKYSIIHKKEY